ncbi:MAG: hypothetical protein KatS3mg104_2961 [Phycisphaerae bacterium]|nr:MAG: hypothetical protein KatS3mg104_2961 [Phycisphaerae bacterium]
MAKLLDEIKGSRHYIVVFSVIIPTVLAGLYISIKSGDIDMLVSFVKSMEELLYGCAAVIAGAKAATYLETKNAK